MKKLRIGDTVQIMTGKAKGQRGKILEFIRDGQYVVIEGVNLVTKFVKKGMLGKGQPGQLVKKEAPVHISNVRLVCPSCGKVTKVAIEIKDNKHKFRKCKLCGALIDNTKPKGETKNSASKSSAKSKAKSDKIASDNKAKI